MMPEQSLKMRRAERLARGLASLYIFSLTYDTVALCTAHNLISQAFPPRKLLIAMDPQGSVRY